MHLKYDYNHHFAPYWESQTLFSLFLDPNSESNISILFLKDISSYFSWGSTNKVAEWYGELVEAMKAHIHVTGFEPIIRLLPERLTSAILV